MPDMDRINLASTDRLFALHSHAEFTRGASLTFADLVWQLTHETPKDREAAFEQAILNGTEIFATHLEQLGLQFNRGVPPIVHGMAVDTPEAQMALLLHRYAGELRTECEGIVSTGKPRLRQLALEHVALHQIVRAARALTAAAPAGDEHATRLRQALAHLDQVRSMDL